MIYLIKNQKKNIISSVGSENLNLYVGPQAPTTNKNTFEEKKMFGNASQ